jgi:hypothetical protein
MRRTPNPKREESERRESAPIVKPVQRFFIVILIMTCCRLVVTAVSIYLLYRAAIDEEKARMRDDAIIDVPLLPEIARVHRTHLPDQAISPSESAPRPDAGGSQGSLRTGETGEFTIGGREGDSLVFLPVDRKPVPGKEG